MKIRTLISASLVAASIASSVSAQDLAVFNFATTPSFAATSTDAGVSSISLSPTGSLGVSTTLTDPTVGGAIDNGNYLFNSDLLFIDRGGWANWGDTSSNITGPFTLTVTADSGFDLSITSFTISTSAAVGAFTSTNNLFFGFFEDGGTGSTQDGATPGLSAISNLDSTVTIAAGTSKTFNLRLNSNGTGAGSSQHILTGMSLQGSTSAIPEPSAAGLLLGVCAAGFAFRRRCSK